jgi:predicted MFS family arabinose efflux permease
MPVGFALGLVISPWLAGQFGWRAAWVLHLLLAVMATGLLLRFVPAPRVEQGQGQEPGVRLSELIGRTVRSSGPWICAVVFACYAGAYLSIVGFLPTIYQQAGLAATETGLLTAFVAVVNVTGNVASGQLIHRGVPAHYLIAFAALCLLIGSWLTYAAGLPFLVAFGAVSVVSAVMGLIPGSLFYLVNRYAPDKRIISASVGLMQQGSSIGQLTIPVVVAAVASGSGGWANTFWVIAVLCAMIGGMTVVMHRREGQRPAS